MIQTRPRPLRRSILYGACGGLLAGLALAALRRAEGTAAIDLWRNAILAGSAAGLAAGLIRVGWRRWVLRNHGFSEVSPTGHRSLDQRSDQETNTGRPGSVKAGQDPLKSSE